ncbi:MAG: hypothetical protein RL011_213, partial [Pseudomonadota bacterium]
KPGYEKETQSAGQKIPLPLSHPFFAELSLDQYIQF